MNSLEQRGAEGKSGVGVLDKSVAILEFLAAGGPASLAAVVEETGYSRATTHRLLSALERHRLVVREGGRYAPGLRLLGWGNRALAPDLISAARPVLEELRDTTGESTQLYVREGNTRVCVAAVERASGLRDTVPVGAVLPLERGSGGRVILAWTSGSAGAEDVRERGWVESVAEREEGVASVSAPVFGAGGELVAAVSVSGPITRLGQRPGQRLARPVLAAARKIERALGSGQ
jgi:DNA-binding IclR family transcriptional regulator